ncbi:MAG: hypothetical protein RLP44_30530 [Aggregatilineales bacterium]
MFPEMFKRLFTKPTQKNDLDFIPILVQGHFFAGKTQFISNFSEIGIVPWQPSSQYPFNAVLDFGRKTFIQDEEQIYLYFFGNPSSLKMPPIEQMFSAENRNRCGSIILVDLSKAITRPNESFRDIPPAIETTQERQIPFVVAMNERQDSPTMPAEMLHAILELDPSVPVLTCNAKDDQRSCELVLLQCLEQLPQDKITQKAIKALKKAIS